jgi:hypothetical protein
VDKSERVESGAYSKIVSNQRGAQAYPINTPYHPPTPCSTASRCSTVSRYRYQRHVTAPLCRARHEPDEPVDAGPETGATTGPDIGACAVARVGATASAPLYFGSVVCISLSLSLAASSSPVTSCSACKRPRWGRGEVGLGQ